MIYESTDCITTLRLRNAMLSARMLALQAALGDLLEELPASAQAWCRLWNSDDTMIVSEASEWIRMLQHAFRCGQGQACAVCGEVMEYLDHAES
jgi:hypothetical protein